MSRILAVDYGTKRLGLALSDPSQILASPLPFLLTLKTMEQTADAVLTLAAHHQAALILLGYPLHLSGNRSFLSDEVLHFQSAIAQKSSIATRLWDERLTTAEAEKTLRLGGVRRKQRSQVTDSLAAVLLLQSYLDSQKQI